MQMETSVFSSSRADKVCNTYKDNTVVIICKSTFHSSKDTYSITFGKNSSIYDTSITNSKLSTSKYRVLDLVHGVIQYLYRYKACVKQLVFALDSDSAHSGDTDSIQ